MPLFVESAVLRPARPLARVRRASGRTRRLRMLTAIGDLVCSGVDMPDLGVAEVLAAAAAAPDLLDGVDYTPSPARYARILLRDRRTYCVLALVWSPGQMSPVHGHRTWCALAVHRGALTETHFRHADGGLQATRSHLL